MSVTDLVILDHMAQTSSPLRRLLVEHSAVLAELVKLRAEVECMRPVFVAAVAWRDGGCSDSHTAPLIHAVDATTEPA